MTLIFDRTTDRWRLDGRDLHCGDGLEVKVGGRWLPVRVEMEDKAGWVLVTGEGVRILPRRALPARPHRGDGRR